MSYSAIEASVDLGQPTTLFEFIYGTTSGDAFRYATTIDEVSLAGRAWSPQNLTHSEISNSGVLDRAELTVTARSDIEVAQLFIAAPPSQPVVLNIWRGHSLTLTDGWDSFVRVWTGRVLSAAWEEADVQFKCEPVATSAKRVGLRRHYQYGCPHVLYGRACGVSEIANTAPGRVASINNGQDLVVTLLTVPVNVTPAQMIGGVFTLQLPDGRSVRRSITGAEAQGGSVRLTLMGTVPELAVGMLIYVARGCLHNFDACKTFNNTSNYGGCPNIPTRDPFRANTF
jgi:hypothetical protein